MGGRSESKIYRVFQILVILLYCMFLTHCADCSRSGRYSQNRNDEKRQDSSRKSVIEEDRSQDPSSRPSDNSHPSSVPITIEGRSLPDLYQEARLAVFTIVASREQGPVQGSGFFISSDGIAVSNYHVMEGVYLDEAEIHLEDGSIVKIKEILARNSVEDYIVFKVVLRHEDYPYLSLAPIEPEVGDNVFAIGTPLGLEQTLSEGIISGYRSSKTLIQTTAESAPGSSGGPLLNMHGEVIGITTATLGEANLNFAINVNLLHLSRFFN